MTARVQLLANAAIADAPSPLTMALRSLDARLADEIAAARAAGAPTLDELRGLYATEERVDAILRRHESAPPSSAATTARDGGMSDPLLALPAWRALGGELAPTALERDLVLLALARDARLDYETVFGFLNDDLTRRWPTRDLALRLLARDDERALLLDAMGPRAPLVMHGVLAIIDAGEQASALAAGVRVTPLASALLGASGAPAMYLPERVTVLERHASAGGSSRALAARLEAVTQRCTDGGPAPLVVLEGRAGSGRGRSASHLAATLGVSLLRVDARVDRSAPGDAVSDGAPRASRDAAGALAAALLWQRLLGAVIVIDGAESWYARDDALVSPPATLITRLAGAPGPVILRLEPGVRWHGALAPLRVAHLEMPAPSVADRAQAWHDATRGDTDAPTLDDADALALADRFDLTPGRIARIARRAADERVADDGASDLAERLSEAARAESRGTLGALAARAPTPHAWSDLVLPPPTLARLRDLADAVRDRAVVLDAWGFARRATRARGITALFAGASGTGKTMAASVIARELALDLFVIDLSGVVSKYIGETEKNLDRVFRAARDAGAILFFDEADALFGKRSEVKDAHDRYANIEVAYLLQQLDAHDGIVILATNASRNLDAAFSRRMRYVVDFPLPGESDRLRLWRGVIPAEAPLAADVDLPFLAASFSLAGGDIRNVALDAAFLAAADGRGDAPIAMRHFIRAMARQMVKQGKTPSAADFRQHVGLIARDG